MTEVRATLYNFRQSPRKVRLVADLVRGRSVKQALARLQYQPQKSVAPLVKLIHSAVASATNNYGLSADSLTVGTIMVDAAVTYKRFKPAAHGSAHPIRRTGSTIKLILVSPEAATAAAPAKTETPEPVNHPTPTPKN